MYLAFTGQRVEQNGAGVKGAIGWPAGGCGAGIQRWPDGEVGFSRMGCTCIKPTTAAVGRRDSDLAGLASGRGKGLF